MTVRALPAVWFAVALLAGGLAGQSANPPAQQVAVPDTLDGARYATLFSERATLRFVSRDSLVAVEVARLLDGQAPLPGLPDSLPGGVRAVLAHSTAAFDQLTGGAVPEWRAGVAIPHLDLIVMPMGERTRVLDPEGRRTLRHEWAHLGLSQAAGGLRAPRWFDEGYAQWASGGFDAGEGWKLRVLLAFGQAPALDSLTLRWPSGRAQAEVAYLLSASAVTYLLGTSGERGMAVFMERWRTGRSFDRAFRVTFGVTPGQFEEDWRKHVKRSYGWVFVLSRSAVFWSFLALVLLAMMYIRTGRNREQLARLWAREIPDEPAFWTEPPDSDGPGSPPDGV